MKGHHQVLARQGKVIHPFDPPGLSLSSVSHLCHARCQGLGMLGKRGVLPALEELIVQ